MARFGASVRKCQSQSQSRYAKKRDPSSSRHHLEHLSHTDAWPANTSALGPPDPADVAAVRFKNVLSITNLSDAAILATSKFATAATAPWAAVASAQTGPTAVAWRKPSASSEASKSCHRLVNAPKLLNLCTRNATSASYPTCSTGPHGPTSNCCCNNAASCAQPSCAMASSTSRSASCTSG
jgi:hypothetical protein